MERVVVLCRHPPGCSSPSGAGRERLRRLGEGWESSPRETRLLGEDQSAPAFLLSGDPDVILGKALCAQESAALSEEPAER